MKEIEAIVRTYQSIDFSKNKIALATVVRVEGSSYRRIGARMLIQESGEWTGGISGGCLEGDTLKRAKHAMATGKATLITYDTTDDDPYQIGVGLGCNGIIDVLIAPLDSADPNNAVLQLVDCIHQRQPNVLLTVTHIEGDTAGFELGQTFKFAETGTAAPHFPQIDFSHTIAADIADALSTQKSRLVAYELAGNCQIQLLIEVITPANHLLIHGTNYDIYPLVRTAKELGWRVTVCCNPQKVHSSLYKIADAVLPKDAIVPIDHFTMAVLMSHDFETDFAQLQRYLQTDIRYIGMLGPAKRNQKIYERMEAMGNPIADADLQRIFNPVGLDIGAKTPEEIAVSIVAGICAFQSGRDGNMLKFRGKPIYD